MSSVVENKQPKPGAREKEPRAMLTDKEIQARFKAAAFQEANRPHLQIVTDELVKILAPDEIYGTDYFPVYKFLVDGFDGGISGANYNHPTLGKFFAELCYRA